jgi:hypothetical protein
MKEAANTSSKVDEIEEEDTPRYPGLPSTIWSEDGWNILWSMQRIEVTHPDTKSKRVLLAMLRLSRRPEVGAKK